MKIIDMKIVVVGNPWKNWIFVKIFTDEGIEGLGECTGGLMTAPNEGSLKELKSRIIGRDPTRVNELIDFVRKTLFLSRGGNALSGIEMACWDIIGKTCGRPLYQLLGGKVREKSEYMLMDGIKAPENHRHLLKKLPKWLRQDIPP